MKGCIGFRVWGLGLQVCSGSVVRVSGSKPWGESPGGSGRLHQSINMGVTEDFIWLNHG